MAGHSKYANIKHRKALQDSKRTKQFTKITRLVFVAAKQSGPDIETNPALRLAITKAKYYNIPKDRIEKAIKSAVSQSNSENYNEISYEGYGPNGVAIVVHALTDNKNRTASEIRSIFTKFGGNLGVDGSVSHLFDVVGSIKYNKVDFEKIFETSINENALDVIKIEKDDDDENDEEFCEILCDIKDFNSLRTKLTENFGDPIEASIVWRPKISIDLPTEKKESIIKMIDFLEDLDDVQDVYSNIG